MEIEKCKGKGLTSRSARTDVSGSRKNQKDAMKKPVYNRTDLIEEVDDDDDALERKQKTELTKTEISLIKQNFGFYDTKKVGSVERFELRMILNGKSFQLANSPACGYHFSDQDIE